MQNPANSMRYTLAACALTLFVQTLPAQNLTVRSVALVSSSGQPQIEVKTSGPVSPATQAVTGPDRIVIDFPGALPATTLRKLAVHRGALKGIRTGLFQSQPPITRVVLDVDGPTDYQVVPSGNSIVIKLGSPNGAAPAQAKATPAPVAHTPAVQTPAIQTAAIHAAAQPSVKIAMAAPMPSPAAFRITRQPVASIPALQVVNSVTAAPVATDAVAAPLRPTLNVGVHSNLLSINAQGATLAEVLYEVHRRTGADIAIPAGAEQERVVVNIPSAPGRDVIASLLNGSRFNYIVLGTDSDPGGFRNLLLSVKEGGAGGGSGVFVHNAPPPSGAVPPPPGPAQLPQAAMAAADTVADQSQMDPGGVTQTGPELEPIPEDNNQPESENPPDAQHPPTTQVPVQNVPDPQAPQ